MLFDPAGFVPAYIHVDEAFSRIAPDASHTEGPNLFGGSGKLFDGDAFDVDVGGGSVQVLTSRRFLLRVGLCPSDAAVVFPAATGGGDNDGLSYKFSQVFQPLNQCGVRVGIAAAAFAGELVPCKVV